MLSLTPTAANRATLVRLRTVQRRVNANLNVLALHLSQTNDLRLAAGQWADLWDDLEAASAKLQRLSEELAAEISYTEKRRSQVRRSSADTEDAP